MSKPETTEPVPISVSEAFFLISPLKNKYKNTRSDSYKVFSETLSYLEKFKKIEDKSVLSDLKSTLLASGFDANETCNFINLLPQSTDEAKICIPSLTRLDDVVIYQAIDKIQSIF